MDSELRRWHGHGPAYIIRPSMAMIYLYPEDVSVDERYNTRLWASDDRDAVRDLIASISRYGQLDPMIAAPGKHSHFPPVLFIGLRRRKAIAEINNKRSESGLPLMKMQVEIDGEGDLFRRAYFSNNNYTPMELAMLVRQVANVDIYDWSHGCDMSRATAYLGLTAERAAILERILDEGDMKMHKALHGRMMTIEQAIGILNEKREKRKAAVEAGMKKMEGLF
jgi:hypothetical protein